MNVLLISSRFPWPAYSGDRLRTTIWLDALRHANVALVAPPGDPPGDVRFYPAHRSLTRGAGALVRTLRDSLPWQSLLASPYAWEDAIARARRDLGAFDATVVILSRLHPWLPAAEGSRRGRANRSLREAAARTGRWRCSRA